MKTVKKTPGSEDAAALLGDARARLFEARGVGLDALVKVQRAVVAERRRTAERGGNAERVAAEETRLRALERLDARAKARPPEAAAGRTTLRGRVVDATGAPRAGVTVEIVGVTAAAPATTAEDGTFALDLGTEEARGRIRVRDGKTEVVHPPTVTVPAARSVYLEVPAPGSRSKPEPSKPTERTGPTRGTKA